MCVVSEISRHLSASYTVLLILLNVKTQAKYVNSSNVCVVHNCPFTALTLLAFLEFGLAWDEQCPSFLNP